jgi:hypothetical protein
MPIHALEVADSQRLLPIGGRSPNVAQRKCPAQHLTVKAARYEVIAVAVLCV